jgi:ABC-type transport system involved in multi-copper enzyme maturation permease subunit
VSRATATEPAAPVAAPAVAPASSRRQAWRELRSIAALETLDGVRSRRQLVVRALTPILLFACVLGISLALRGEDTRNHPQAYRVAVQGDFAGAQQTLPRLRPGRLVFEPTPDARQATIDGADVGLVVPDHLDERLAQSGTVPIEIQQITTNAASSAAAVLIQAGFVDLHAAQVQARLTEASGSAPADRTGANPRLATGSFSPNAVDVELTATGTRSLTSQVVPGLICLQAALLIAGTANRLVGRRTRGLLMVQLLLPVSRRGLATAKGLGELVIGLITAAPIVVAVLVFGAVFALRDGTVLTATVGLVATVSAMIALFAFTTAVGVWIGTAARTQEQVSLATGAAVVAAAVVATTVALGSGLPAPALVVLPFAGLVGTLREVLNGTGSVPAFVVALGATLVGALAVSTLAGRSLDAERMVVRNG